MQTSPMPYISDSIGISAYIRWHAQNYHLLGGEDIINGEFLDPLRQT